MFIFIFWVFNIDINFWGSISSIILLASKQCLFRLLELCLAFQDWSLKTVKLKIQLWSGYIIEFHYSRAWTYTYVPFPSILMIMEIFLHGFNSRFIRKQFLSYTMELWITLCEALVIPIKLAYVVVTKSSFT